MPLNTASMKLDETALDILERRLSSLELQVFDKNVTKPDSQSISDLLLQTHTMIASALTCRESIVSFTQRLPQLNELLDPNIMDTDTSLEAKRLYILEVADALKDTAILTTQVEKLQSVLDVAAYEKVPDLNGRLDVAYIENIKLFNDIKDTTNQVLIMIQKQNEIVNTLKVIFAQFDCALSEIEKKRSNIIID